MSTSPRTPAALATALLAAVCLLVAPCSQAEEPAWLLTLHAAVSPATADYIVRNLQLAHKQQIPLVIIEIDTPGGLDQAMRDIVRSILDSTVPVACLVAPAGARAASAGTYILYACHIAAMGPATNLGAATPVAIASPTTHDDPGDTQKPKSKNGGGDAMHHKAVNDAAAYIRALAQLRGRNAEWGELAVRDAATLTASEALAAGVIDLIADTPAQLLQRIDGRQIVLKSDQPALTLHTANLQIRNVDADWRNRFLTVITNPNVAYVLMLLGVYGLVLEAYHPGAILPGTVGAIALLLALYAFQVLPINYSGFALILLGLALMVAEAMVASFGVLGISGIGAFVVGSILLFDTDIPGFRIALSLILAFAAVSAALLTLVIGMIVKTRRRRHVSGIESWIGESAEAVEDFDGNGMVRIGGELWNAQAESPIRKGQQLRVTGVNGLKLRVDAATNKENAS